MKDVDGKKYTYSDGGTAANNPSLIAFDLLYEELMTFQKYKGKPVVMISINTGHVVESQQKKPTGKQSLPSQIRMTIESLMIAQDKRSDRHLGLLSTIFPAFSFYSFRVPIDKKLEAMDDYKNVKKLSDAANTYLSKNKQKFNLLLKALKGENIPTIHQNDEETFKIQHILTEKEENDLIETIHALLSIKHDLELNQKDWFLELQNMDFIEPTLPQVSPDNPKSYVFELVYPTQKPGHATASSDGILERYLATTKKFENDQDVASALRYIYYPNHLKRGYSPHQNMSFLATGIKECLLVATCLKAYCEKDSTKIIDYKSHIYWPYLRDLYNLLLVDYNKGLRVWERRTDRGAIFIGYNLDWDHYLTTSFLETIIPSTFKTYITELHAYFKETSKEEDKEINKHKKIIIHGSGGMGKSTLARAYVKEATDHNFYDLIVWVNAENEENIKNKFLEVIRTLEFHAKHQKIDVPPSSITERSELSIILRRVNDLLVLEIRKSPLFIFDSAESYEKVHTFIPQVGHTIVTTLMDPGEEPSLKLNIFSDSEALAYIQKRLDPRIIYSDIVEKEAFNKKAKLLAQKLGNHPLALSVACGYITNKRNMINIDVFIKEYDTLFQKIVRIPGDCDKSLLTTLQMSLNLLTEEDKNILYSLFYLQADNIPVEIVRHFFKSDKEWFDFLFNLDDLDLIRITYDEEKKPTSLSLHRLTQDVGRYIFEQTEEFKENKQAFFENLQISLERFVFDLSRTVEGHKKRIYVLNSQELQTIHTQLHALKLSWQALIKNAPEDVTLIDRNAYFVRILQNKIGEALLKIEDTLRIEELLKNVIMRQLQIDGETFGFLNSVYDKCFPHITDITSKKTLLILLGKFEKEDTSRFDQIDPTFFKDLPFETCERLMHLLLLTHEEPVVDLRKVFETSNAYVQEGEDPFLSLFVNRYLQNKHSLKQREYLKFLNNLCFKNLDPSFHTYKQTLYAWASCSSRQRNFLEIQTLNGVSIHHDVNGLLYLSQKTLDSQYIISDRHVEVLQRSLNYLTNYIKATGKTEINGEEFWDFLKGLNSFIKVSRMPSQIQQETYNRITTFMDDKGLAGNIKVFYSLLEYSEIKTEHLNQLFDADVQKFLDRLKGFFEFYKYNEDIQNASIQKLKELEKITSNTCENEADKYIIYNAMEKVLCIPKESLSVFYNILNIEGMSLYDQVLILEWISLNVRSLMALNSPTLENDLKAVVSFLKFNHSATEICEVLSIPLNHNISYQEVLSRFKILHQTVLSKTPLGEKDTKEWITSYIGGIEQKRFNFLMNHLFLQSPLSIIPISIMIKIAAESTDDKWNRLIQNPLNEEAFGNLFGLSDTEKFIQDLEKL
ncbi:MAG: hypothetical protein KBD31_05330 [Proteobacteria bacterium]|nr:hypothetical protein [Pseudomonadota bacterium]